MDLIFNEESQMWEEYLEPYAVIDCPTETDFKKLQELFEAQREGRLIVLPSKDITDLTSAVVRQLQEELAQLRGVIGGYYDIDRLRELVNADKDGRCVIFPCRPSDVTVYQLRNKKHARGIGVHPRHIHCATVWANGRYQFEHQGMEPCKGKDLGKTWFLTAEAAEAALAKEEEQCDVK